MRTFGDVLSDGWANYIARSKKKSTGNKERKILTPTEYGAELKLPGYSELYPARRREIAQESPLLMKGINKKALDTFRAWFTIEPIDKETAPISIDIKAIENFNKKCNFKQKCVEARIASFIYGNGFILLTFLEDKGTPLSAPPTGEPIDANLMNSEYIIDTTPEGHYKYQKSGVLPKTIHKDRIIHFKGNVLPGFNLGFSTIDLLRWTMFSKKNVDIAAGHILAWFSHGIQDFTIQNMTPEEQKETNKIAEQHPGVYTHDQDTDLKIENPTAIDPKPFYDYVVLNIAAALNMPTHVLTGVQIGRVTGSEIGFADYYRDVKDDQEIYMTPAIESVYQRIIEARGRKWKYELSWNPIYIDEMSEANLLKLRTEAAELAYNGSKSGQGFINQEESRMILNKGQIQVDPSVKVKPHPLPTPKPTPGIPTPPGKPPSPPSLKVVKKKMGNQEMIDRLKKRKELIKKELDELEDKLFNVSDKDNRDSESNK